MALVLGKTAVFRKQGADAAMAVAAIENDSMAKVLLIEDDSETAEEITAELAERGFEVEWAADGIRVNAVAPGPTATDLFLNGKSAELIDRLAKMNPMERLGTTADIASVVAFLVGPDGGWINGQVLRANGGMV